MAHVIAYEELRKTKPDEVVYQELKYIKHKVYALTYNGLDFTDGKHYLIMMECDEDCLDYNWNYRVWNKMPTEEEMDNTPWREDPYV